MKKLGIALVLLVVIVGAYGFGRLDARKGKGGQYPFYLSNTLFILPVNQLFMARLYQFQVIDLAVPLRIYRAPLLLRGRIS